MFLHSAVLQNYLRYTDCGATIVLLDSLLHQVEYSQHMEFHFHHQSIVCIEYSQLFHFYHQSIKCIEYSQLTHGISLLSSIYIMNTEFSHRDIMF